MKGEQRPEPKGRTHWKSAVNAKRQESSTTHRKTFAVIALLIGVLSASSSVAAPPLQAGQLAAIACPLPPVPAEAEWLCSSHADISGYDTTPVQAYPDIFYRFNGQGFDLDDIQTIVFG